MEIKFPSDGINKGQAAVDQPMNTSPEMNNVRRHDTLDNRDRGGQRPGLDKWGDGDRIGAANQPVVAMCIVTTVE